MAEMCESCIYAEDEFCIALAEDCSDVCDEDCYCYSPIMDSESDEG